MSNFVNMIIMESWRSVVDKVPLVGTKIVDRLTKPILDKIMKDPDLRKYIKRKTMEMFKFDLEGYKQEYPNGERTISLKKPSKFVPLANEREVRAIDDDMINYEYTIDNIRYRVSTDGKTIRRVYVVRYQYIEQYKQWYEELASLYAPSKDELAKMWKPIDDGELEI